MSDSNRPLLEAYDLRKDYEGRAGRVPVLKGVHFDLKPGELSCIVGRSGSGKSTLLHLLAGLDTATSGKILFEGEELTGMREKQLSRIRNLRIGLIFQFYHLLPELTVYENVLLPSLIARKPEPEWAKEVLRRVKLSARMDHYPSQLSGGEQQRAAIARGLINRPSVILCDEPTGNLDEETAETVLSLIHSLNQREGQAFVIVTHDEAMARRSQNVHRLVDGMLIREGGDLHGIDGLPERKTPTR